MNLTEKEEKAMKAWEIYYNNTVEAFREFKETLEAVQLVYQNRMGAAWAVYVLEIKKLNNEDDDRLSVGY